MQSHQALIAQACTTRAAEAQLAKMAEDYVAADVTTQKETLEEIMELAAASHPKGKSIRHTNIFSALKAKAVKNSELKEGGKGKRSRRTSGTQEDMLSLQSLRARNRGRCVPRLV